MTDKVVDGHRDQTNNFYYGAQKNKQMEGETQSQLVTGV